MKNPHKRVPQYAIAEQLGLSRSTVSKVFANRRDVSEETKTRVMEAAASMGYRKPSRQELGADGEDGAGRGATIGMLIRFGPDAPADYRPDYLHGVSSAAVKLDASLVIHCIRNSIEQSEFFAEPELQPTALRMGRLDGLMLSGDWTSAGMIAAAEHAATVAITFGSQPAGVIDVVEPDTLSAMRLIVEHLAELGHRRIAFVGLCRNEYWTTERYAGFVASAASLGLDVPSQAVIETPRPLLREPRLDPPWMEVCERLRKLNKERGVTAIACCSDWAAFHVHWGLSALGVSVPDAVSLVGFDDHEIYTLGQPPITTTHVPRTMLAEMALRRVIERIKHPAAPIRRSLYHCGLVDHGTTASPRI